MRLIISLSSVFLVALAFNNMAMNQRSDEHPLKLPDTKAGLHLSIDVDRESYRLEDIATLTITLKNVSQQPITIFKKFGWGPSSSFVLSISDEQGKEIERTAFADASHWPPFSKEDFITLQPGESIRQERDLDLEGEEVRSPGLYQVNIWYHSPIPRESAPVGLKIWSAENGTLQAKPINFRVTK